MSVTNTAVKLWKLPIPVAFSRISEFEEVCIRHYNQRLGETFFVTRDEADQEHQHYIYLDGRAPAKCSIGYRGGGRAGEFKQTVGYKLQKKEKELQGEDLAFKVQHTILHELGHCIGLEHEQFHTSIPLVFPKPKNQYANPELKDAKDEFTRVIWQKLDDLNCQYVYSLVARRTKQDVRCLTPLMDWNSIMMYGPYRKVFKKALLENKGSSKFPSLDIPERLSSAQLSDSDVRGIRLLYLRQIADMNSAVYEGVGTGPATTQQPGKTAPFIPKPKPPQTN